MARTTKHKTVAIPEAQMRRAVKQSPLKPLPRKAPKSTVHGTRVERPRSADKPVPDMLTILTRAVNDVQRQKVTRTRKARAARGLSPANVARRRARGFPSGR